MCDELKKEIENSQSLGRRDRRYKEKELQKKYNDKTIRIKSGKKFKKSESLSKADRRMLIKDKNLVREIMKIIHKYLPQLMPLFTKLTDKRHKSYITYNMRTIIMTRLLALICGITTMTGMNDTFNTESAIENLSSICNQKLNEVPDWQTIQDVIEDLSITEIEDIRKYIIKALIRSKMFDRFRHNGSIQMLVDATCLSSHNYDLNGNCLTRTTNGKLKYYKYILEAKLVFDNIVISLDSEWIENTNINTENEKQDCEINAFKRMAPRIKKNFPKLRFLVTGDALYANKSMMDICKDYNWDYIFNLKRDRLKNLYDEFTDNVNYQNETTHNNYYLSSNMEYRGHTICAFKYVEIKKDQNNEDVIITFNYISNLKVNNSNIIEIVDAGRRRWKIENEGFNEQKNGTFCISHLCSRNENALKIHYLFIQIAHVIRQLLEYGSLLLKGMKLKTKKEVSKLITQTLTSHISNLNNLEKNFQLRFDN